MPSHHYITVTIQKKKNTTCLSVCGTVVAYMLLEALSPVFQIPVGSPMVERFQWSFQTKIDQEEGPSSLLLKKLASENLVNRGGILSDTVPEDEPLRLKVTQNTAREELPPQSRVSLSDVDGVKLSGPSFAAMARLKMRRNSCKQPSVIWWNVQSMKLEKAEVVQNKMELIKINILGISELKWAGVGHFESGNHIVYYAENDKLKRKGLAFIVIKNISRSILKYNTVGDRIIFIRLQGKPVNTTIIQIYISTTKAKDEEIEDFYQLLQSEIDQTYDKNALIITDNRNGKDGNKEGLVVGKYGLGDRNNVRDHMIEFCKTNDFFTTNTIF
ncbi:craniofacial development protein 2-like isoform 1-T2 [Trichechus inunguis]